MVTYLCHGYQVSARRACRTLQCACTTYQYRRRRDPRYGLMATHAELMQTLVRYGYR